MVSLPGVLVLILTGHSDEDNIQQSVKLGIHGFLTKPVSKANLEKIVMSAISSPPIYPRILERK
jgi:DNA-binding NarL/FixJ family response regulator